MENAHNIIPKVICISIFILFRIFYRNEILEYMYLDTKILSTYYFD